MISNFDSASEINARERNKEIRRTCDATGIQFSELLHLHHRVLGKVPLTCGCFCVPGLIHHKPVWKHHAKLATFTLGNPYPTLCE